MRSERERNPEDGADADADDPLLLAGARDAKRTLLARFFNSSSSSSTAAPARSCTGLIVGVFVAAVVVLFAALLVLASVNHQWAQAEKAGNELSSLFTRAASLQERRAVAGFADRYGDTASADDVRTGGAGDTFSRLVGQLDVHPRRIDWALELNTPRAGGAVGARVSLWVQAYNRTRFALAHAAVSPLVLCAAVPTDGQCAGTWDAAVSAFVLDAQTVLSLCVQWANASVPWIVPV